MGLSTWEIKASGSLGFMQNGGRDPAPLLFNLTVPRLRPANPPFSFKAAKYLIALTDVGLFIQCRLRGSSKEREAEVSKNKSNTDSQGEG